MYRYPFLWFVVSSIRRYHGSDPVLTLLKKCYYPAARLKEDKFDVEL